MFLHQRDFQTTRNVVQDEHLEETVITDHSISNLWASPEHNILFIMPQGIFCSSNIMFMIIMCGIFGSLQFFFAESASFVRAMVTAGRIYVIKFYHHLSKSKC